MKKIIITIVFILTCFSSIAVAQNFEITNNNTSARLIKSGTPKRFLIDAFAICLYDSLEYIVYHNWMDYNKHGIVPHSYYRQFQKLNNTNVSEKQERCKTLKNSKYIAIVELPDSILKFKQTYINDTLHITCQKGKYLENILGTTSIKATTKGLKMFLGYGGLGGKQKKPVLILYK